MDNRKSKINRHVLRRAIRIIESLFQENLPEYIEDRIYAWLLREENRAEKEAALWAVFDREEAEVPQSEEKRRVLSRFEQVRLILGFPENIEAMPIAEQPARNAQSNGDSYQVITPNRPRRWRAVLPRVAAVFIPIMLFVGGILLWNAADALDAVVAQEITVRAADGQRSVTLPDGSAVRLERGTEISWYDDFITDRAVRLAGEAVFDVVARHDALGSAAPFTVEAGGLTVHVLGTVFRVNDSDSALSTVSLYEGRVQVKANDIISDLRSGELFTYDRNTRQHAITLLSAGEMLENGHKPVMRFDNSSLGNLITAIAANYDIELQVADGIDTTTGRFSGDLEGLSIDAAADLLTRSNSTYSFTLMGDSIIVERK